MMRSSIKSFAVVCACGAFLAGCSGMNEAARGFMGVSTKALEDRRDEAISESFALDQETCFLLVHRILKEIGTYIYRIDKKKHLIAVYVSEKDTTPVGVFVSALDDKSVVEVSSRSSYAKELIAGKLFPRIRK